MAAFLWDNSVNILIIPCNQEMTVLGFRFTSTVTRSWMSLVVDDREVKTLARDG